MFHAFIFSGIQMSFTSIESVFISVATLLLRKSTGFHDKKTLDSQKNTGLQKQTCTQWKCPENALQCQP